MRPLFILLILLSAVCGRAQKKQAVFAEALGIAGIVSANYDTRLNSDSPWGLRVGLGYTTNTELFQTVGAGHTEGFSIPVNVNYLMGRGNHHFECGIGISNGFYKETISTLFANTPMKRKWGCAIYSDIGYRYQKKGKVFFRGGITPGIIPGGHWNTTFFIAPYIGVGYSL